MLGVDVVGFLMLIVFVSVVCCIVKYSENNCVFLVVLDNFLLSLNLLLGLMEIVVWFIE